MFYRGPELYRSRLLIIFYDFLRHRPYGHIGLGINATHSARVLRTHGIAADVFGAKSSDEISQQLCKADYTHCLIEAPWVSTDALRKLTNAHPHVHFIVRVHSQIGFLQVEAGAIKLIREQILLSEHVLNFHLSANSKKLQAFLAQVYGGRCVHLPNLYFVDKEKIHRRNPHDHRTLRIGAFGAVRLLKNFTTACAAALEVAHHRGCDLEFFMNDGREENGRGVLDSVRNMTHGLHRAKLVLVPWEDFASFKRTIGSMDLTLQPSFSETFNLVTADSVSQGVPSVVSSAIEWLPAHWQADSDSVADVARVAGSLLSHPNASEEGLAALERFQEDSLHVWKTYFAGNPT